MGQEMKEVALELASEFDYYKEASLAKPAMEAELKARKWNPDGEVYKATLACALELLELKIQAEMERSIRDREAHRSRTGAPSSKWAASLNPNDTPGLRRSAARGSQVTDGAQTCRLIELDEGRFYRQQRGGGIAD